MTFAHDMNSGDEPISRAILFHRHIFNKYGLVTFNERNGSIEKIAKYQHFTGASFESAHIEQASYDDCTGFD